MLKWKTIVAILILLVAPTVSPAETITMPVRFRLPSSPGVECITFQLSVRSPYVEWWQGWPVSNCRPDSPRPHEWYAGNDYYACSIEIPATWGCVELRPIAYGWPLGECLKGPANFNPAVESATQGVCPTPAPVRESIAKVSEPSATATLLCGIFLLSLFYRRNVSDV